MATRGSPALAEGQDASDPAWGANGMWRAGLRLHRVRGCGHHHRRLILCLGLRSAAHAFLPASVEVLPPRGQVFPRLWPPASLWPGSPPTDASAPSSSPPS
jgi:hypothetical protein